MKKEFIAKETEDFKLRVRMQDCSLPVGVKHLEFINEQYKDGKLIESSAYQFFMTDGEIHTLCQGLLT